MKICTVKSPFFWILLVVVVFVIIGGFWYVNIPSPELEEAEIALNRVWWDEEMEIVLAGEVSDGDEGVAQEETLPPKPKKVERKVETTEIAKDSENTVLDPVAEDEEVEITFECETGDDVAEE